MITLESLLYGIRAMLFGLPLSIGVSYVIHSTLGSKAYPFRIDPLVYLATILVIFLIVGSTMFYGVHALKKDSIIDTLKQEINE